MQLESLLLAAPNKRKILKLAFIVLERMKRTEIFPLDQVCYRILIELYGKYDQPAMAVKVLQEMQRAGLEQNAVTYGIYHHAVMDAKWPSASRQRACQLWNVVRIVFNATDGLMKWAKVERRQLDTQSDNGYHSDNKGGGVTSEVTVDYEITYTPIEKNKKKSEVDETDDNKDPLGAMSLNSSDDHKLSEVKRMNRVEMSPSRAKFFADHASTPFAQELTPKADKRSDGQSWLKDIANSPMFKMIRSTTFDSPKLSQADDLSDSGSIGGASPSLNALVNQVNVMPTKLRLRMASIINKSYSVVNKPQITEFIVNPKDPAYILDSGSCGTLLDEEFWMREVYLQLRRSRERQEKEAVTGGGGTTAIAANNNTLDRKEVVICSATMCPSCRTIIYDEDIMAGWKVDDQNLNTTCPHCYTDCLSSDPVAKSVTNVNGVFAPRLTVRIKSIDEPKNSYYSTGGLPISRQSTPEKTSSKQLESFEVAFLSPLVLRRELEAILTTDREALQKESLKDTDPIVFWNLVFYMRRLGLPSHLFSWIAERHHIRCVLDIPDKHKSVLPLYLSNPAHSKSFKTEEGQKFVSPSWELVTGAVQKNELFKAIQTLINDARKVGSNGQITLGPHFPIFRDIQFASLDLFERGLLRDSLDEQYCVQFSKLPPKIAELLPSQDYPLSQVTRACRKVFLPLDLY